jgi:hypothetical protein
LIRFLSHILRFILITIGFVLAVVAASAFMVALAWGGLFHGDPQSERLLTLAAGLSLPVMVAFAGYYSFLPGLVFAILTEVLGRRSWLFHALGGMAVAALALAMRSEQVHQPGLFMVAIAAGAVGGTVYWLVAGRSAGKHLDEAKFSAVSSGS